MRLKTGIKQGVSDQIRAMGRPIALQTDKREMKRRRPCIFCGEERTTAVARPEEILGIDVETGRVCNTCASSLGTQNPKQWLRWLKANDKPHWDRVVDHHRLGCSPLSDAIRRLRIESRAED